MLTHDVNMQDKSQKREQDREGEACRKYHHPNAPKKMHWSRQVAKQEPYGNEVEENWEKSSQAVM